MSNEVRSEAAVSEVDASAIEAVLQFWFGDSPSDLSTYSQRRKLWFGKQPAIDQEIHQRFYTLYLQAAGGELATWQASPLSALALIVLLDQFPRNMFRDTAQAFATDFKARAVAKAAISQGFDRVVPPVQRIFFYLPLEHSEDLADQQQSVQLAQALANANPELADIADYALRHQVVIERFGRFPHRNRILGRKTTPQEAEFLQQPGSSF